MRLIDGDGLRNEVHKAVLEVADTPMPNDYASNLAVQMGKLMLKKIDAAPAVDAVEVVRCKDCKHREIFFNDPTQMFCHKWLRTMQTDLNFYCAYGEKMDTEVQDDA